jgi:hypothetical protein
MEPKCAGGVGNGVAKNRTHGSLVELKDRDPRSRERSIRSDFEDDAPNLQGVTVQPAGVLRVASQRAADQTSEERNRQNSLHARQPLKLILIEVAAQGFIYDSNALTYDL